MNITIIGTGNVATRLGVALQAANHTIVQIIGRNAQTGHDLAQQLNCRFDDSTQKVDPNAELIIIAVSDNALENIIAELPFTTALVTHTAGSMPMSLLQCFNNHGVIYPFQTLSRQKEIDMTQVPLLIEGNTPTTTDQLGKLAKTISNRVTMITSEQRQQLHLAAVFACNFTNHLYAIAHRLLTEKGLDFALIRPLIEETAAKIWTLPPHEAQTGPAVRHDDKVMEKHLKTLATAPDLQTLYRQLSAHIMASHQKK